MFNFKFNKKKIIFWIVVIVVVLLALYMYTYFFANKFGKIIYQDSTRRIYLIDKGPYTKPGREMWRMVYEDQKSGKRFFITGNSLKGFPNSKMVEIILNTIDSGKTSSYDLVQGAGVTIKESKTDIHSNIIGKKSVKDFLPNDSDLKTLFPAV